jgi:hypothetical protein
MVAPKSTQVQESDQVMTSEPAFQIETKPGVESEIHGDSSDTELPIALRKGTRECTKKTIISSCTLSIL